MEPITRIHEPVFRLQQAVGDRPAVVGEGATLSYRALATRAAGVAARLRSAGVRPGDTVAVYAHRDPALVVALLGVLRAGAAFAVLDTAYPPARLARMAAAAGPAALLTTGMTPPVALTSQVAAVLDASDPGAAADPAPAAPATPTALAYVAFTSGTTGAPRAVLGGHAPVAHYLGWSVGAFGFTPADRFAVLAGLSHDPLLREVLTPLWLGGTVLVPSQRTWSDPPRLARWLHASRATVLHLTPSFGQRLAGARLPGVRHVGFGGEVLLGRDAAAMAASAPGAALVNLYGTTETPQAASYHPVAPGALGADEIVPLGRGIDGFDLEVVAASGGLAAPGQVGEIHVRSPYLSLGYKDDPVLTRERFGDGDRYRTGDLGYRLPDGTVAFAGRSDRQVKVHGVRVELAEVEHCLREVDGVKDAVVAMTGTVEVLGGHPGGSGLPPGTVGLDGVKDAVVAMTGEPPSPVAWVVGAPASGLEPRRLRAHLASRLPAAAVPERVEVVDALPLGPNGKLDLPALAAGRTGGGGAPAGTVEQRLVAIWEDVLETAGIGVEDDFFELGGDSLAAMQVAVRVEEELGRETSMTEVFQHPTVRALSELIGGGGRAGP